MKRVQMCLIGLAALFVAVGSQAMFRAADLVVIPAAASTVGSSNSDWHTDLEIRNVDSVPVDVEIVLLPRSGSSNELWYDDVSNHLGGRSSDGFGHINEALADIQPGQVVELPDVIRTYWGDDMTGALLVFGYEAGTLQTSTPPGGVPRLILVDSRTYSVSTDDQGNTLTYGQEIPGLPWYDFLDSSLQAEGLDHVVFMGLREDADYRTNLGLVNVSDELTSLDVIITLTTADGTVLATSYVPLPPLADIQFNSFATGLFGLTSDELSQLPGSTLKVAVVGWTTGAQDPHPALMTYLSRVDNNTNDPVYLEQTFEPELPYDCVFGSSASSSSIGARALSSGAPRWHLRAPEPKAAK